MSRIGKTPVTIPSDVKVSIDGKTVGVEGKLGKLSYTMHDEISVEHVENQLVLTRINDERNVRALHGLSRALINNMVVGVSEGYVKTLILVGTGYSSEIIGPWLKLGLGYSHDIYMEIPKGIEVTAEPVPRAKNWRINNQPVMAVITAKGINKEEVGNFSAEIRKCRPPENYKGKGVRYEKEHVIIKPGKAGGK